jgi:hypothetical protein
MVLEVCMTSRAGIVSNLMFMVVVVCSGVEAGAADKTAIVQCSARLFGCHNKRMCVDVGGWGRTMRLCSGKTG